MDPLASRNLERPKINHIDLGNTASKNPTVASKEGAYQGQLPPHVMLSSQSNTMANNNNINLQRPQQNETRSGAGAPLPIPGMATTATVGSHILGIVKIAPNSSHPSLSSPYGEQHQMTGLRKTPSFNNACSGLAAVSATTTPRLGQISIARPDQFNRTTTAVDPNPATNSLTTPAAPHPLLFKKPATTVSTSTSTGNGNGTNHAHDFILSSASLSTSITTCGSQEAQPPTLAKVPNDESPLYTSDLPSKTSAVLTSKNKVAGSVGGVATVNGSATKNRNVLSSAVPEDNTVGARLYSIQVQQQQQQRLPNMAQQQTQKQHHVFNKQQALNNPRAPPTPAAAAVPPPAVLSSGLDGPHRTAVGVVQNKHHKPPLQVMQAQPPQQRLQTGGPKVIERVPPQRTNSRAVVIQPINTAASNQQQQQQQQQRPMQALPAPPVPVVKELKVEDALRYLDQVKEAFGDRPRIYNEFLEIMKNFKSQQIDTPGVIKRVSNLFNGYNNLILGFNTFLPEGYKIELRDLEQQQQQQQQQDAEHNSIRLQQQQQLQQQQKSVGRGKPQQQVGPPPVGHIGGPSHGRFPSQPQQPHHFPPPAQVQQQPSQQQQQPKPQAVPQIRQVAPMPQQQQQQLHHHAPVPPQITSQQQLPGALPGRGGGGFQPIQQSGPPPSVGPPPRAPLGPPPAGQAVPNQQQQQNNPTQAVEFDHAISYVTTIKKRFENQPQIYQQFLEILHTYQKEQRGIKEVLEQVSSLFANHPDLLKEFTYFLPDAVQEQSKERLNRAVVEHEARMKAQMAAAAASAASDARPVENTTTTSHLPHKSQPLRKGMVDVAQQHHQQQPIFENAVKQQSAVDSITESKEEPSSSSQKQPDNVIVAPKSDAAVIVPPFVAAAVVPPPPPPRPPRPSLPETYIYNAAVERQFFDTLKEALTSNSRDGGVAWAEFLKCLDLYAQEVLSRVELLGYVEELLGKRNADLFDEFKRVLSVAGYPTSAPGDDTWFAVPLSEIDFARCRKCSPSYRALPRDYPVPPCSDRLDLELSVLNNVWVSLPVGSEESYTFRQMRRNQYEETLFRVEDERMEIDMVIDSNASTLRRLEPIAEEICLLSRKELSTAPVPEGNTDVKSQNSSHSKKAKNSTGAGGKQFQYVLDKKILTTIHVYSIMRIYGDFGQNIIKLLFSNPTKTVPIVVKRLRQKDREWREARIILNRRWKELVDQNYIKCLDHRSLTWRTLDKRATSTRTLLAEIRDRACNNGMESESALATKREKAREEYGSFYEVTMGRSLRHNMDLTNYPKPTASIFTPHLSVIHENISWAHLDAYRVLAFALERGNNISPVDKDRGHRLLRDFIGPLFGLSYSVLYGHGINTLSSTKVATSNYNLFPKEEATREEDTNMESVDACENTSSVHENEPDNAIEMLHADNNVLENFSIIDQQPVADGTIIATVFGEGILVTYRSEDNVFVVQLAFGLSYLHPNAIICSLQPVPPSSLTDELRAEDKEELPRGDLLLMGNQSLYLFFRLHDVLVKRLNVAKKIAFEVSERGKDFSCVETITSGPSEDPLLVGRKRYESYLSLLYHLLEGGSTASEGDKYEDRLRSLMGHYAFELATMDKLVAHLLKNLQNMGNDEILNSLIQLYKRHLDSGSFKPNAFRQEAALLSEGEMIYAFQYCRVPNIDQSIMFYEYLGCISESDGEEEDSATGGEDNEMTNDTDGEGNTSSQPSSKRLKR